MTAMYAYIGSRVQYKKNKYASRNGWLGTIRDVVHGPEYLKVFVQWDELPGETVSYRCDAVVGFDDRGEPAVCDEYQYLHPLPNQDESKPLYIVAGENGGKPERVRGLGEAQKRAHELATHSKSGQRYIVFTGLMGYERTDPPVRRIDL